MNTVEILKTLSYKQRFMGLIVIILITSITSLGTAYLKGSDCTEISEKYTKSIQNYNHLIEIMDQTQKNYIQAKKDIIEIQFYLKEVLSVMNDYEKTESTTLKTKTEMQPKSIPTNPEEPVLVSYEPPTIIIKENTVVTKTETPEEVKIKLDSIVKITNKYEKQ